MVTDNRNAGHTPECCLVLMFKAPVRSKRRLAVSIGPRASIVAEYLCRCALEDMAAWRGPVCFAPASEADGEWLAERFGWAVPGELGRGASCQSGAEIQLRTGAAVPGGLGGGASRESCPGAASPSGLSTGTVVPQRGGNLGERINHIDRALRSRGFGRQIFIGIDCPELDQRYLGQAAAALDEHDVVLGPALDGGVVLMGARSEWPDLGDLAWSSANLMAELERLCTDHGWTAARLPRLADIDTLEDLDAFRRRVSDDPRPARRALGDWLANGGHRPDPAP